MLVIRGDVKLCCNPKHLYDGDYITNGRDRRGIKHKSTKRLTLAERVEIHERLSKGESCCSLADEFGVSDPAILRYKKSPVPTL